MDAIPRDGEAVRAPSLDPAEVCTLPRDGLNERLAWIRDEILAHARRTERFETGLAWELDAAPGLKEKLDRLIALERECCSGIVFERRDASAPGRLRLGVRGIDPDAAVFQNLEVERVEGGGRAPRPGAAPTLRRWIRLAKAGSFGVLASLAVCCAIPLLAAALVGGAVAAPLAALDQPWVIGLGGLVGAAAAWWWLRRRDREKASGTRARGCGPGC